MTVKLHNDAHPPSSPPVILFACCFCLCHLPLNMPCSAHLAALRLAPALTLVPSQPHHVLETATCTCPLSLCHSHLPLTTPLFSTLPLSPTVLLEHHSCLRHVPLNMSFKHLPALAPHHTATATFPWHLPFCRPPLTMSLPSVTPLSSRRSSCASSPSKAASSSALVNAISYEQEGAVL